MNDKVDSLGRSRRADAGADAHERRPDRRSRPEGGCGQHGGGGGRRPPANRAGEAANAAANTATRRRARDAVDKASKRIVFEVVLSEDQGNFKFGKT